MKDMLHEKEIENECLLFFQKNPFSIESVESLQVKLGRRANRLSPVLEALLKEQFVFMRMSGTRQFYELNRDMHNEKREKELGPEQLKLQEFSLALHKLTKREKDIIRLLLLGRANQEVADALFISPNTVKNHISNIYVKLKINDRYELISMLYQWQTEGAVL